MTKMPGIYEQLADDAYWAEAPQASHPDLGVLATALDVTDVLLASGQDHARSQFAQLHNRERRVQVDYGDQLPLTGPKVSLLRVVMDERQRRQGEVSHHGVHQSIREFNLHAGQMQHERWYTGLNAMHIDFADGVTTRIQRTVAYAVKARSGRYLLAVNSVNISPTDDKGGVRDRLNNSLLPPLAVGTTYTYETRKGNAQRRVVQAELLSPFSADRLTGGKKVPSWLSLSGIVRRPEVSSVKL